MKCSSCGRVTDESGRCTSCSSLCIYPSAEVAAFLDPEELRSLILKKVHQIRKIGFDQVQLPLKDACPSARCKTIDVIYTPPSKPSVEVLILPCIDSNGYEAVMVGMKPKEVKDGQHRGMFSNN